MPTYRFEVGGEILRVDAPSQSAAEQALIQSDTYKRLAPPREVEGYQNPVRSALLGMGQVVGEALPYGEFSPQDEQQMLDAQAAYPLSYGVGQAVPYVGASLAAAGATGGMSLPAQIGAQAAAGGAIGLARGGPEQALYDAALAAGGDVAGRAVQLPFGLGLKTQAGKGAQAAQAAQQGYEVMPSTYVDAPRTTQIVQGGLESLPGASMPLDEMAATNQALYNRQAAEAIGETAAEAPTDTVLADARKRIGETLNRLTPKGTRISPDSQALQELDQIADDALSPFVRGEADPVSDAVERMREVFSEPDLDARDLFRHQSWLGKKAQDAFSNRNSTLGHALSDMQDLILDLLRRNASKSDAAAFDKARQEYRVLSALESPGILNPVSGDVSAPRLASYLSRRDRAGFLERQGEQLPLYEGTRFLGRNQRELPSSSTTERGALQRLVAQTGLGATGGAGVGYTQGDPLEGAMYGAGLLGGANLAGRAYTSAPARNWMTRSLPPWGQTAARLSGQLGTRAGVGDASVGDASAEELPPFNPEQRKRLSQAVELATEMGAENVARQLSMYRNRVLEGKATAQDLNAAQKILTDIRDRARKTGNTDLTRTIESLFLDTRLLFVDDED